MNEKHLEFLQNNITRMNQCSFQMKGWAITVVSAFMAIYVTTMNGGETGNKLYLGVSIASTLLFWMLDSLYLSKERKFIGIYNDVAGLGNDGKRIEIKPYEIPLMKYRGWKYSIFRGIISPTELFFYGMITTVLVIILILN